MSWRHRFQVGRPGQSCWRGYRSAIHSSQACWTSLAWPSAASMCRSTTAFGMATRSSSSHLSAEVSMPYLTRDPIEIAEWHACAIDPRDGASVEFVGVVRGAENDTPIASLDYEAYEPMAERVIERLVQQARAQWPVQDRK